MKKTLFLALAAFALCACPTGGGGGGDDGGKDANDIDPENVEITVSGTASIHPDAVAYFNTSGQTLPGIGGLTLRVEEPLKAALQDPTGYFGTLILTDAGTFSVSKVPSRLVTLGVAAGVFDDAPCGSDGGTDAGTADGGTAGCPRVVRAATSLYDVALEGGQKPTHDIVGGKAYAIPTAFHDKLTAAVTPAKIQSFTSNAKSTLIGAGFILGRVVNAAGAPVAGAVLKTSVASDQPRFLYPSTDYSTVTTTGTSANGLFLYVHNADSNPKTFKLTVEGKPEYVQRNGGAAKDACLIMTVYPGTTPPP
jgi:hypothetical protein